MIKHSQITQSNISTTSKKMLGMEVIFDMQINVTSFYKLVLSFLVEVARHVQNT